ncbi:MAG: cation:proton antiporter [Cytophagales bacterium]|nr:cation:proton antiporter [Bernardetiaceae bacterium]MDW8205607.1 cation:proton antiporter [Cytophagales bacterium]
MNWLSIVAENPFYEFSLILLLAVLLGALGQLLRQPLIVIFIALGILVGPSGLDIIKSKANIHLLSDVGIAILLFIVGLKLDLRIIKSVGSIALLTGLGQVIFTSLIGYCIGLAMGFSHLHSFYIAVALTFSSTIIIVKLLSDKKEIDSLHGQIAIGFLIVQDMVVILVMIILSAMRKSGEASLLEDLLKTLLSGLALVGMAVAIMRFVIPYLSLWTAKSQELLSLFAVAWAVSLSSASEMLGFSREVGAFLAGIGLASSEFKDVISSRLTTLRDFLLLFFFVHLGIGLNLQLIGKQLNAAIVFSLFVLIGNPVIVLLIMGLMGYRKRTAFLAGLTVAQISEFSLIFAGLGLSVGHINQETLGLITLVGLVTIGLSTYMILYSHQLYEWLAPLLSIFERKNPYRETLDWVDEHAEYDLIIFGYGRFGGKLIALLEEHPQVRYLCIDFDPFLVRRGRQSGVNIIYGDIEDPDLLMHIPFQTSRCIVNTVADVEIAQQLFTALRQAAYTGKIFQVATNDAHSERFSSCGADRVLVPHSMAAANFYNSVLVDLLTDSSKN